MSMVCSIWQVRLGNGVRIGMSVARDREPWVDWQDIPLTAESLNEVYAGIQTAGAFLFITSSDFASLRDR